MLRVLVVRRHLPPRSDRSRSPFGTERLPRIPACPNDVETGGDSPRHDRSAGETDAYLTVLRGATSTIRSSRSLRDSIPEFSLASTFTANAPPPRRTDYLEPMIGLCGAPVVVRGGGFAAPFRRASSNWDEARRVRHR